MSGHLTRGGLRTRIAGISILEALVATAILGIGLVGVGSMVTYSVVSHRKSVNYTVASARAMQELERIREAGYLSAQMSSSLFPSAQYVILNSTQASFAVSNLPLGAGVVTITEDPEAQAIDPDTGQPYANLKRAVVRISWRGSRHLSGTYQAATLIANRP